MLSASNNLLFNIKCHFLEQRELDDYNLKIAELQKKIKV